MASILPQEESGVVFAHLKLIPGCLSEEPCPALPEQQGRAAL
jgi:hypothetical protein